MAFAIAQFNPIVAFGIEDEKTLTATPAEGSTVMAFDNSGATVVVGDPVFVRSADETVLQYRGLATVVGATQITVQIPLQDAVGASATCWVPTNFVRFTGERRASQVTPDDDGTITQPTSGGEWFAYQFKDPTSTVDLSFLNNNTDAYDQWLTFRNTDRRFLIDSFNLAFYHNGKRKGVTIKVKAMGGPHSLTTMNVWTTGFSQTFAVEAETPATGVYVES